MASSKIAGMCVLAVAALLAAGCQKKVADDFRNAKIALTFKNYPGAHEWRVWRNSLADLVGLLFQ